MKDKYNLNSKVIIRDVEFMMADILQAHKKIKEGNDLLNKVYKKLYSVRKEVKDD